MAIPIPLQLLAGESRTYRLTVVADDSGDPVDLTGAAIEFQLKRAVDDADPPLLTKSIGAGITLLAQTGATLGRADLELAPVDAQALTGMYVYDIVVTSAGRRQYVVPPSPFNVQRVVNG
jgi:hypothetical protein